MQKVFWARDLETVNRAKRSIVTGRSETFTGFDTVDGELKRFVGVVSDVEDMGESFEVTSEPEEIKFSPAELAAKLADHDAAIVGLKERIGAAEIAGAKRLRIIANLSVGYDNLDLAALTAAGIAASNTADVLNESVADYTWALLLGAAIRLLQLWGTTAECIR